MAKERLTTCYGFDYDKLNFLVYFEFSQNVNIFKNNPMFDVAVEILKISPMFGSIGEYFENYPMFDVVVEIFLKLPFGSAGEYFENYFYVWSRWRKF